MMEEEKTWPWQGAAAHPLVSRKELTGRTENRDCLFLILTVHKYS